MKSIFKFIFLISIFFQDIISVESPLIDKSQYYADCIASLEDLSLGGDYNQLLAKAENSQVITDKSVSLDKSVLLFAEAILQRAISSDEIISLNGQAWTGLSGNPIFKVGNSPKQVLVIKAFKGGSGAFSKEFLTLYTYNQNVNSYLKFPRLYEIGSTQIGQDRYFLIGIEFVDGVTVQDLFIKLFHLKHGSQERNDLLVLLQKINAQMGHGLAQFHYQKRAANMSVPSIHLQTLEKLLSTSISFLKSRTEGVSLAQELQIVIKTDKWIQATSQPFDLGYMHTDAHAGNFIANLSSGDLHLIDTGTETIGPKGNPIGLPFFDIAQVYNQLCLKAIWGLSSKEIDVLWTAFMNAYTAQSSSFPTNQQMAFFQLVDMLKFFAWYSHMEDKLDKQTHKIIEQIYLYRIEKCRSIIRTFSDF